MSETVFVALGSNLGDRAGHLDFARRSLARLPRTRILAASSVEETVAITLGGESHPPYLNQMVLIQTDLLPAELLALLHRIEEGAGRVRKGKWEPRTLDLDIVIFGDREGDGDGVTLPHPGLSEREFWRREIAEIRGELMNEKKRMERRITTYDFGEKKRSGEKIVVVSAYDALFARLAEEGGVDAVLVGDSLANVILGMESTLPVTLDQMIHHGAAARRGVKRSMLIVDMPFLACQMGVDAAIGACGRVMQETGAGAVKIEGADDRTLQAIGAVVNAGIPVMGHLGFTPQSVHALGGARVQGRGDAAERVMRDAMLLQEAGVFSMVLELVPADVAAKITASLAVPTIGIGAGVHCDGQVLVLADLLGLTDSFTPRYLRRYAAMAEGVRSAVREFGDDVRASRYPADEHSF